MRKVVLKVNSASVVDTSRLKSDGTLGRDGKKISSPNDMDNLVHFNHVSNMLHVLLGARPVSSCNNGYKFRERSPYIDEIAKTALFRYDNAVRYKAKNGQEKLITTMIQGKKPYRDSNRKISLYANNGERSDSYLTWDYVRRRSIASGQYLTALMVLDNFAESIGGHAKDYALIDLLVKMRDYPEWLKKLNAIGNISPITNFVNQSEKSNSGLTDVKAPNYGGLSNMVDPTNVVRFDATIIVFMNDEDAENLINGKQSATFLDMGCVSVEGTPHSVYDLDFVDEDTIDEIRDEYIDLGFLDVKKFPCTNRKTLLNN